MVLLSRAPYLHGYMYSTFSGNMLFSELAARAADENQDAEEDADEKDEERHDRGRGPRYETRDLDNELNNAIDVDTE
jgi:hypothetical protein